MSTDAIVASQELKVDDLGGLAYQLLTTGAVGFGAIVFFCLARPYNEKVYQPNKVLQQSNNQRSLLHFFHDAKVPNKLPEIPKSTFGWIKVVFQTTEQELLDSLGMDATMFVKILYAFVRISAMFLVTVVVTMLLNSLSLTMGVTKSNNIPNRGFKVSDWDINQAIIYDSSFIWGHVVMAFILSGTVFYIFNNLWLDFIAIRQAYYRSSKYQQSVHGRTILVTNLKPSMLSDEALCEAMHDVKVSHYLNAKVGMKASSVQELVEKREAYIYELEQLMNKAFTPILKNQLLDATKLHIPDNIKHVCTKITNITTDIEIAVDHARTRQSVTSKPIHAGFVVFESVMACHDVVKALEGRANNHLKIEPAPHPSDLVWHNLGSSPATLKHVTRIGNLVVVGLCFGWLFLLNALLPLTNPRLLVPIFPALGTFLDQNRNFASYFRSMMPPLLYNGFLIFVPILFRKISDYQGAYSKAIRTRYTLRKVYLFYVLGYFMMFTLSATAQKILANVLTIFNTNEPQATTMFTQAYNLINDLTNVFISSSAFWLGYCLNGTGFIHIELVRAAVLAITFFKRKFFSLTPRDELILNAPPEFMFDEVGAIVLFYFFLSMVFALVQPLIIMITPFYFLFATLIYKWELMYIFGTGSDTGGDFFPTMYKRVAASVLSAQGIFLTLMLVKKLWSKAIAIFVLFIASFYVRRRIYRTHLDKAMYLDPSFPLNKPLTDSQQTLNHPYQNKEYLYPALINHLIMPMVDPRLEYILEPYFPDLVQAPNVSPSQSQPTLTEISRQITNTENYSAAPTPTLPILQNSVYLTTHVPVAIPVPPSKSPSVYASQYNTMSSNPNWHPSIGTPLTPLKRPPSEFGESLHHQNHIYADTAAEDATTAGFHRHHLKGQHHVHPPQTMHPPHGNPGIPNHAHITSQQPIYHQNQAYHYSTTDPRVPTDSAYPPQLHYENPKEKHIPVHTYHSPTKHHIENQKQAYEHSTQHTTENQKHIRQYSNKYPGNQNHHPVHHQNPPANLQTPTDSPYKPQYQQPAYRPNFVLPPSRHH